MAVSLSETRQASGCGFPFPEGKRVDIGPGMPYYLVALSPLTGRVFVRESVQGTCSMRPDHPCARIPACSERSEGYDVS